MSEAIRKGDKVQLKMDIHTMHSPGEERKQATVEFHCPFDGTCRLSESLSGSERWNEDELEKVPFVNWKRG